MGILSAMSWIKHNNSLPWLRRAFNMLYYDPETVILHLKNFDTVTVDGCHFYADTQLDSLQKVRGNKWFDGVLPEDTVLDIGANIGAITIPLAKKAKRVYAVEPIYHQELAANVLLNGLTNVTVLPLAIGKSVGNDVFEFAGREAKSAVLPFQDLLSEIGGHVDFIKIDCEGGEWDIEPQQLQGIRQIRIEFHVRRAVQARDRARLEKWLTWLGAQGYTHELDILPVKVNPYYSEMSLLRAWK